MDFTKLREHMASEDSAREVIIKQSRDILKLSKQAIYSLHRDDAKRAAEQLEQAKKLLASVPKEPRTGALSAAREEYTEGRLFQHFLEKNSLLGFDALDVEPEEYLKGLSDFTGELGRYAVLQATKKDKQAVEKARDIIENIFGELVQFDFRNSDLRRKYDSVKYNLKKVENLLCELSLS